MTSSAPSPYLAGLRGRCPNCGQGPLFARFLTFAQRCTACGADFSVADVGDGAAVFVMFVVGAVVVPFAFILQFGFNWPTWATMFATFLLTIGLSLGLLRPFKATLFALQWKHKAAEGRLQD